MKYVNQQKTLVLVNIRILGYSFGVAGRLNPKSEDLCTPETFPDPDPLPPPSSITKKPRLG